MKNLFLFPFRLAGTIVKVIALFAALILVVVLLMPGLNPGESEPCTGCQELQEQNAALQEEVAHLQEALSSEYLLLRRIDLRFLPQLGQDWLRIRGFAFWDEVSARHFEQCPEGTRETIWSSTLFECALTTIERSCNQ